MKKATIISGSWTTNDHLPQEIVIDILYQLPVKSLCRFKCVSPSWKTLISSHHFAQTHLSRTKYSNNQTYKAILFSGSFDLYSVDFADSNPNPRKLNFPSFNRADCWFRSLSSCNGLVLVSDDGSANFLLNPSTGEYKKLPESPFHKYSSSLSPYVFYPPGLGYDSHTDDYKVVLLFNMATLFENMTNVAVYSLKTDAWKMVQSFPIPLVEVERVRGYCFNERLHWLCRRSGRLDFPRMMLALDLTDEIFSEVQLPALCDDHEFRSHDMVALGGCLGLLVWLESDQIDVWMMMEYGVRESWTKFSIANPWGSIVDVLCLSGQDKLVFVRGRVVYEVEGDKLVLYDPKEGTWRDVVVPGIPKYLIGDNYMETLVPPNHGGRISDKSESSSHSSKRW